MAAFQDLKLLANVSDINGEAKKTVKEADQSVFVSPLENLICTVVGHFGSFAAILGS